MEAFNLWRTAVGAITHTDFKIRKNLYDALKRLRSKYHDVYLWVDAICIDQSEKGKTEKEGQLAMMSIIYNSASNVCVWLGEDDSDGAESAFDLVKDIMNYRNFDEMACDPHKIKQWSHLVSIMKSNWFGRRWIIQEIALSRNATIHRGNHKLHWDDFADAVSLLMEKIDQIRSNYRDEVFDDLEVTSACILIQTLGNICRKSDHDEDKGMIHGRLLDVEMLVSTLLGFRATFPRDTIYSILSLAKDSPTKKEDWQNVHRKQLERVRDEKLSQIKHDLEMFREWKGTIQNELISSAHEQEELHKSLQKLDELKGAKLDARTRRDLQEVRRLNLEIRALKVEELEAKDEHFTKLQESVYKYHLQIKKLERLYERTRDEVESQPVGLLPNYDSSPRDLFIAFVTRSIYQSNSLDIICRHWAPSLSKEDGSDLMPSWISGLARAPYGVPGTAAQGRQNGENFVAYLPHDQRGRYSASRTSKATFKVMIDPALHHDDMQFDASKPSRTSLRPEAKGRPAHEVRFRDGTPKDNATQSPATATDADTSASAGSKGASTMADDVPVAGAIGILSNARNVDPGTGDFEDCTSSTSCPGTYPEDKSFLEEQSPETEMTGPALPQAGRSKLEQHSAPDPAAKTASESRRKSAALASAATKSVKSGNSVSGVPTGTPRGNPERKAPISWTAAPHRLSGILVVEGLVLGRIAAQSEVMRGGIVPGEWVTKLGWERGKNDENWVPDTLWRLLVADRTAQGGRPPQWYKRACLHGLVDGRVSDSAGNIHPMIRSDRKISELTSKYFDRVESVVWNRRIIEVVPEWKSAAPSPNQENETAPSYVPTAYQPDPEVHMDTRPLYGLGPAGGEVGGIVCIFFGCSVPVVLRAAKTQRVEFLCQVVGESYVHGMMDGEAMLVDGWEGRTRSFRLA
ncbi:heterokaryon incompatibility protein-domain-containing protein [Lasiosphaeris hirsuta]|uniref:Heterokaryon incompatibility protein-domain-containing protein n=1 Tax=Lasiosphaeris hirsuta TaxID=260670 RepID=A0AA40B1U5_9PEZI|nr:heterokaryon incompatibility protein-domain-containing protein [Lasiosphaeris hirsuta]